MSSNNQIVIEWDDSNSKPFEVHENSCVDNDFKSSSKTLIKRFKTLQESVRFANKYCVENMVEYGVHINDRCWNDSPKKKEEN